MKSQAMQAVFNELKYKGVVARERFKELNEQKYSDEVKRNHLMNLEMKIAQTDVQAKIMRSNTQARLQSAVSYNLLGLELNQFIELNKG